MLDRMTFADIVHGKTGLSDALMLAAVLLFAVALLLALVGPAVPPKVLDALELAGLALVALGLLVL
jgi:hypothetical protein